MFAAITCPEPQPWDDLVIKPDNYTVVLGSTIHVSCPEGYFLENARTSYTTTCIGLGDWSVPLSSCRSKYTCSCVSFCFRKQ